MLPKKDSIAKGGSSVAGARLLGMLMSFLLFLVLARHSASAAGVFRTVSTYLIIAEFIGMLGMHRWLATEIATNSDRKWSIFLATNLVMCFVALVLSSAYLWISHSGIYSPEVNIGIQLAIVSLIPTSIYQCVQSAFIGIGKTYIVGVYNAGEFIFRCTVSILLVYFNHPVTEVIGIFILSRWCVALGGLYQLTHILSADHWKPRLKDIKHVFQDSPKFLVIIAAHIALRNAALVMIPALINDESVAYFSVAYQLFDMIMIIPSVLAISSNHVFVNMANHSASALTEVSAQLLTVTSMTMFPCIAITAAFSTQFLLLLYGPHYIISNHTLVTLMVASGITMLDQVLSQIMTAQKDYKSDMISILFGGISASILTYVLILYSGFMGAAVAYLITSVVTVIIRIRILNQRILCRSLFKNLIHPFMSAVFIYIVCLYLLQLPFLTVLTTSKYLWLTLIPFVLVVYTLVLYLSGGLEKSKLDNMRIFLFHH